jgi:DNA-binding response OmpR family regulator
MMATDPLLHGNLEIRPDELQVICDDRRRVGLTVREFQTFMCLVAKADRVVTREQVYDEVWGGQMPRRDRSVDVFVRKIRTKLATCSPQWVYIHTHFGIGYRFFPEPAEAHFTEPTPSGHEPFTEGDPAAA